MRHRPIKPKHAHYKPPKIKRYNQTETVYLTGEQQAALTDFQKTVRAVAPKVAEANMVAQRLFQEMVDSPEWRIIETPEEYRLGEDGKPAMPEVWKTGHAKVNYVDHIDSRRDEEPKPFGGNSR
jgi:hypothetical protein